MTISLRRRLPAGSSTLPIPRRTGGGSEPPGIAWACTRWGLPSDRCRQRPGVLLPHLFTLTSGRALTENVPECDKPVTAHRIFRGRPSGGGLFLWHCPYPGRRQPGRWALPTTVSCRARTFLVIGQAQPRGHLVRATATVYLPSAWRRIFLNHRDAEIRRGGEILPAPIKSSGSIYVHPVSLRFNTNTSITLNWYLFTHDRRRNRTRSDRLGR